MYWIRLMAVTMLCSELGRYLIYFSPVYSVYQNFHLGCFCCILFLFLFFFCFVKEKRGKIRCGDKEFIAVGINSKDWNISELESFQVYLGIFDGSKISKDRTVETTSDILFCIVLESYWPSSVCLVDFVEIRLHVKNIDNNRSDANNSVINCTCKPCCPFKLN